MLVALIPPAMPLQGSTMVLQSRVSVVTLHTASVPVCQCASSVTLDNGRSIRNITAAVGSIDGQEDEVWWEEEG